MIEKEVHFIVVYVCHTASVADTVQQEINYMTFEREPEGQTLCTSAFRETLFTFFSPLLYYPWLYFVSYTAGSSVQQR